MSQILKVIFIFLVFNSCNAQVVNELGLNANDVEGIDYIVDDTSHKSLILNDSLDKAGYSIRTYYASDGIDFNGRTSNFVGGTQSGMGDRTCLASSTESFVDHKIVFGKNDVLEGISYWVNDTDIDDNFHVFIYESCLPNFSAGPIKYQFHIVDELPTSVGNYSRFIWVNKSFRGFYDQCKFTARVRFGSSAANCAQSPDLIFQKFRVIIRKDDLIFANGFSLEPF